MFTSGDMKVYPTGEGEAHKGVTSEHVGNFAQSEARGKDPPGWREGSTGLGQKLC